MVVTCSPTMRSGEIEGSCCNTSAARIDDYCFIDEHAGDYQTYLEDMEQDEIPHGRGEGSYEERRWEGAALTF